MDQITIETRRLLLRLIDDPDLPTLYGWRNEEDFLRNCSYRRTPVSFEDFKKELVGDFQRDRHIQLVIMEKVTSAAIGTIYSYNFKRVDGYLFVTTFITKAYQRKGYGAEAFAAFVNHLLSSLPLFKIYLEVYEYNLESLLIMKGAGFVEEGRFRRHRLIDGKRYDVIRFAIYREDRERFKGFLERLQNQETEGGENNGRIR